MARHRRWTRLQLVSRIGLIALMSVFSISTAAAFAADSPGQGVFSPVDDADADALVEPVVDSTVTRARAVRINFGMLGGKRGQAQAHSTLRLNLFPDTTLTAVRDRVEETTTGPGKTWLGHIEGEGTKTSLVAISVVDGKAVGKIHSREGQFQIRTSPAGGYVVTELDREAITIDKIESSSMQSASAVDGTDAQVVRSAATSLKLVDIMVIYTKNARQEAGGKAAINAAIETVVSTTNRVLANSRISGSLNLRLVHTQEVGYTEVDRDNNKNENMCDRGVLSDKSDGTLDHIDGKGHNDVRGQEGADLVAMVPGNPCRANATPQGGHSVTSFPDILSSYTFTHEIGHNLGAQHDWYQEGSSNPSYRHGYVNAGGGWRTMMAYNKECKKEKEKGTFCRVVPVFSNPDVRIDGVPAGVPGGTSTACSKGQFPHPQCDANNAKHIEDRASTTASWEDSQPTFQMETGRLQVDSDVGHDAPKKFNFDKEYQRAVIVTGPPTNRGSDPVVVRVDYPVEDTYITKTFDIQLQEWDHGPHKKTESVPYLAMEAGHFTVNGTEVEAGIISTNKTGTGDFKLVSFKDKFNKTPVVKTSLMTLHGKGTVTTRVKDVSRKGFKVAMQEREANTQQHKTEAIGYVAWEPSSGTVNGRNYEVDTPGNKITHQPSQLSVLGTSLKLHVDEETAKTASGGDSETHHNNPEKVGYLAFDAPSGPPVFLADMQTTNGWNTASLRTHLGSSSSFTAEIGNVQVSNSWETVRLSKDFDDPIVVAKPASFNGSDPATVRVRNVSPSGFQIRMHEYNDGIHGKTERVGYLVMERGHFTLSNGASVEAGTIKTDATDRFVNVPFASSFDFSNINEKPVVLSTVTSWNGQAAVVTRNMDVSHTGFKVTMQERMANNQTHNKETISYIAFESSNGKFLSHPYEAGITDTKFSEDWRALNLTNLSLDDTPSIHVDEEQPSRDSCCGHTNEQIGYVVVKQSGTNWPIVLADMQTALGQDTANLRYTLRRSDEVPLETGKVQISLQTGSNNNWETVKLTENFSDPIVVAKTASHNGSDPTTIRLRNVSPGSFDIRLHEWNYLNGTHTTETVSWVAVEQGEWKLPNGTKLEAGAHDQDNALPNSGAFDSIQLDQLFGKQWLVFSSVGAFNGKDAVTTRHRDVSGLNYEFQVAMQEQGNKGGHTTEPIYWIAIQPGSGMVNSMDFEAGSMRTEGAGTPGTINFNTTFSTAPCIIADMQTFNGPDTANLRYDSLTSSGMLFHIDELGGGADDNETSHNNPEKVGYLAFDCRKTASAGLNDPVSGLQLTGVSLAQHESGITFTAMGQQIEAMQVEIYDLSGNQVFDSGHVDRQTLHWTQQTDQGRPVANGVYLSRVTVEGPNGETVRSKIKKLVVLR